MWLVAAWRWQERRHALNVPEISRFFGIVIGMFYAEHGVPHFPRRVRRRQGVDRD
jgi:hypothetical protein